MKKLLFILTVLVAFSANAQNISGYVNYLKGFGPPSDTAHPMPAVQKTMPHLAVKGDDTYIWSVAQQKWIILISGGNTYSNGFGLLLSTFQFKADTSVALVSKLRLAKALDSLRILTGSNFYNADGSLTSNRTVTAGVNNFTMQGFGTITIQNIDGGSLTNGVIFLPTNKALLRSSIPSEQAYVQTEWAGGNPNVLIHANTGAGQSDIRVGRDSIQLDQAGGKYKIRNIPHTNNTDWPVLVVDTTAGGWRLFTVARSSLGTGGGGGGGTIKSYSFENIIRFGFDSAVKYKNDSTAQFLAFQHTTASSRMVVTRTAYGDTAVGYAYDVNEASLLLQNIGGLLPPAKIAAGGAVLGQALVYDGFNWVPGTVSGGSGNAILNQAAYQTAAMANIRSLKLKDTLYLPGGGTIIPFAGLGGDLINLSSSGPSAIGFGDASATPAIALVASNGQWLPNALAGDIAYRNAFGRLIFGNNGSAYAGMYLDSNQLYLRKAPFVSEYAGSHERLVVTSSTGQTSASPINTAQLHQTLATNTTDVGNIGTGEDDLMTYSLGAGKLATDGDYVVYEMSFQFASNANAKTLRIYFGSASYVTISSVGAGGDFVTVNTKVTRTGAATQRIVAKVSSGSSGSAPVIFSGTQNLAGAVTIKATGDATTTNDVVQKTFDVYYSSK